MRKQRNITFKVWLEIERYNGKIGASQDMDAPVSSLAGTGCRRSRRSASVHGS